MKKILQNILAGAAYAVAFAASWIWGAGAEPDKDLSPRLNKAFYVILAGISLVAFSYLGLIWFSEQVDTSLQSVQTQIDESYTTGIVKRVIDGDTIVVTAANGDETVRLIGVDTPESVNPDVSKNVPQGIVASDFTKSQLEGKEVFLEFDVDRQDQYGRTLAYVWVDNQMFNKVLLEEGYATLVTYTPNVKYVDDFTVAQQAAQDNYRGLWAD